MERLGTCPRGCTTKLEEETFQTIRIDRCPTCRGVWLDPGELEQIAPDNTNALRAAFDFFAGRSRTGA
jgi:Zn-finger nucleic acid-binding protein